MKLPIAWLVVSLKSDNWKEVTDNLEAAVKSLPDLKGKYNFVYLDDDK